MAGGTNSAKQIVIDEANALVAKIKNGNSADPQTQGEATALILKMITPLYQAEFVTKEECIKSHEELQAALLNKKPANKSEGDITELNIGPMHIKGRLNAMIVMMILLAMGVVFAIGKSESWW